VATAQASDVKIVGEKGSKVPNLSVRELSLVLECHLEASFQWTALDGWQPARKLQLEIIQLEHSISGTSVPLPKTLLKYLLNMLLPNLIEARLAAVLAAELGQYFIDKATPGMQLGGKLNVAGPSLGVLNADLATTSANAAGAYRRSHSAPSRCYPEASTLCAQLDIANVTCCALGHDGLCTGHRFALHLFCQLVSSCDVHTLARRGHEAEQARRARRGRVRRRALHGRPHRAAVRVPRGAALREALGSAAAAPSRALHLCALPAARAARAARRPARPLEERAAQRVHAGAPRPPCKVTSRR
jgi:hypothetical protein